MFSSSQEILVFLLSLSPWANNKRTTLTLIFFTEQLSHADRRFVDPSASSAIPAPPSPPPLRETPAEGCASALSASGVVVSAAGSFSLLQCSAAGAATHVDGLSEPGCSIDELSREGPGLRTSDKPALLLSGGRSALLFSVALHTYAIFFSIFLRVFEMAGESFSKNCTEDNVPYVSSRERDTGSKYFTSATPPTPTLHRQPTLPCVFRRRRQGKRLRFKLSTTAFALETDAIFPQPTAFS